MKNPLLSTFSTPFETVPFGEIQKEHFLPAIKQSIIEDKKNIAKIRDNPETPTFSNVCEALDRSGEQLKVVYSVFLNLCSTDSDDDIQKLAQEISPMVTEHDNNINLDDKLFQRVKSVYDRREEINLNTEESSLLEKQYREFTRNGALLDEKDKDALREIDNRLSKLSLQFSDNCLAEVKAYKLVIDKEEDLIGLPDDVKEAAFREAKERGEEGKWVITLDYPSYIPFMTYSQNRPLREKLLRDGGKEACKGNKYDNREILKEIALLRHKRANLLGYQTHADFVLEERMAETPKKVQSFLEELLDYAKPIAQKELDELKVFAKENGQEEELQSWDYSYWLEKLKKSRFDINDEMLRPYFQLENVIEGVFKVAQKLYGLRFRERQDIPVYHKDVKTYEVLGSQGEHVGVFYGDFFPRPGKRSGAWMTQFRSQYQTEDGKDVRPHVTIVCNFTKPGPSRPSLLTFREVQTLFHEFGHSLHGLLSRCRYHELSGTSVYWDFVELPSQLMENWTYEKECLDLFASHFETGEHLPEEVVKRIAKSATFFQGIGTLRQLGGGFLDMGWHTQDPSGIDDVEAFEDETTGHIRPFPKVEGSMMSPSFGHIFVGGYSAGYYSYKWAEVLDADAFEFFKEKGIFNQEVASRFKAEILEKGGSEHPAVLYRRFRGKDPELAPLLKRMAS